MLLFGAALGALATGCPQEPKSRIPQDDWAYARVIDHAGDLVGGPVAEGEPGDLLIGNRLVRFVIQGHENPRTLLPYGGSVIDADVARAPGEPGEDRLQELGPIAGYIRVVKPESIRVVSDGRGGKPARVRVLGKDAGMPLIDTILPLGSTELAVQVDYVLEPYSESLRIETTYTSLSEGSSPRSVIPGDALLLADLLTLCTSPEPGCGQEISKRPTLVGAYAPGKVSYGYFATNVALRVELQQDDLWLLVGPGLSLGPGESGTFTRYLAVASSDPASLIPEVLRRSGLDAPLRLSGQVSLTGAGLAGEPALTAVDLFTEGGEWITRAITTESGDFVAWLPPESASGSVSLTASQGLRGGDAQSSTLVSPEGSDVTEVTLTLPRPALVTFDLRDEEGDPLPGRIQFHPGHDATPIGRGEHRFWSVDGSGEQEIPPGDWTAVVTRGYEYDPEAVFLTAVAGQSVVVAATLVQVVDTSGYLSIDTHTHTRYSIDSQLDERQRVAQAAAEHVEVVVTSEHDVIFDLGPTITDMGARHQLATIPGIEISPLYGHINAYPVSDADADRKKAWPVSWWETDEDGEVIDSRPPTAIFGDLRAKLGAQVIQLNHPRESQGVLNYARYDPTVGFAGVSADVLSTDFNAVEIQNAGFDQTDQRTMEDWFSFLNQGLRTTAVGVSDSHGLSTMLGLARTLVVVPDDTLSPTLDLQPLLTNLLAQRAVVVSGPFVELWALDSQDAAHGMGEQVSRQGTEPLRIRVRVQAPSFVETARLVLFANGQEILRENLPDPGSPPAALRLDHVYELPWSGGDLWVVALVEGDRPMWPLLGDRPRSVTNPVYIDANGDGTWTPPGL